MALVKWFFATQEKYKALAVKDDNALYFITDTNEIYKGAESYTESVIMVDEFPDTGIALNKLYVNPTTFEAKVHNGTQWVTVSKAVSNTLSKDTQENDDQLITGAGIKNYVSDTISDIIAEGGVTAKTVQMAEEIEVKGTNIGAFADGDKISTTDSVWLVIKKMLQTRVPATYTQPAISMSIGNSSVEAGTKVSGTITTTFTKNDAGDLNRYVLAKKNGSTVNVIDQGALGPYEFNNAVVGDTNLSFTATCYYNEGAIKNDNLGDPSPDGHILAGNKTVTRTYTAFRRAFYAAETDSGLSTAVSTSAEVRALANKSSGAAPNSISITVPVGTTRITIAYPASKGDIKTIAAVGLGNMDVSGSFTKSTVEVEGAEGYTAITYNVYSYIPAVPFPSADTYNVSI